MKKSTLIKEIHKSTNLPKEKIETTVNTFLDTITQTLKEGESVSLFGFGSFLLIKRKPKEVYIPGTTKKVLIKEKYSIKFKPSNKLKAIIENPED